MRKRVASITLLVAFLFLVPTALAVVDISIAKGISDVNETAIRYDVDVINLGDMNATDVIVTEVVPGNTTFNFGKSSSGWSCSDGDPAGTVCTYNITAFTFDGVLEGNAAFSPFFVVDVLGPFSEPTTIHNVVNVTNSADINLSNNAANISTVIRPTNGVDLYIQKDDNLDNAVPGQILAYAVEINNTGLVTASGVVVTEIVPGNTTFNSFFSSGGWSCSDGDPAGTACTFTVPVLGADSTFAMTFAVNVNSSLQEPTLITNTVNVTDDGANGTDLDLSDNVASDTTLVTSVCGDGNVQQPNFNNQTEQCDDGNTLNGDGCSSTCEVTPLPICEEIQSGCDLPENSIYLLGNDVFYNISTNISTFSFNVDFVNTSVFLTGISGGDAAVNGFNLGIVSNLAFGFSLVGNTSVPPGCGTLTMLDYPNGSNFTGLSPVQFRDSNLDSVEVRNAVCQSTFCGNGVIESPEQCDDNNTINGDGCSSTCELEPLFFFIEKQLETDPLVFEPKANWTFNITINDGMNITTIVDVTDASGLLAFNFSTGKDTYNITVTEILENRTMADFFFCGIDFFNAGNPIGNTSWGNFHAHPGETVTCFFSNILTYCGDGMIEAPNGFGVNEVCDDGNRINGDGCSNICQPDVNACDTTELYLIEDTTDVQSDLYRYLVQTQTTTNFGPVHSTKDYEASAINPQTNEWYGLAGHEPDPGELDIINKDTGFVTNVASLNLGNDQEYQGASFHPITNELWAGDDDLEALFTIDITTGQRTFIALLDDQPEALGWTSNGSYLYWWDNDDDLHRYDPVANISEEWCIDTVLNVDAMEFDVNGNMVIEYDTIAGTEIEMFDPRFCFLLDDQQYNVTGLDDVESLEFFCNPCPRHIDADNDGIGDNCDRCPNSNPRLLVNEDGCDPFQFCGVHSCSSGCYTLSFTGNVSVHDCTVILQNHNALPNLPACVPVNSSQYQKTTV